MSKFTNTAKSATRKVTRSVPVFTAKNVVEDLTLRARIAASETRQSRDRYFELKDEAKARKAQEKARQEEQARFDAYLAQEALVSQLVADANEVLSPDAVIVDDSEPVHISRPLVAFVSNTRDRVSTSIRRAAKQDLGD